MPDIARVWKALPPAVRYPLLANGSGAGRLLRIARSLADAVNAGSPSSNILEGVLCDMVAHAWEINPFARNAAALVLQLHEQMRFLTPPVAAFCAACGALRTDFLDEGRAVGAMLDAGDTGGAKAALGGMAGKEPGNLFWFRFAAHLGFFWNELDWFEPWLETPSLPPFAAAGFRADLFFARSEWERALALYRESFSVSGLAETLVRAGECAKKAGRRELAAGLWKEALSRRPWQVNLVHRLYDLEHDRDLPGAVPRGRGEIFLYSWNNARELDQTLASLAESETGNAAVTVLDNGSRDGTGEVIAAWAGKLGGRFCPVTLPVNIGAPAARNWLLGPGMAADADWVVFVDDDAVLPRDWLRFFGKSMEAFPGAAVFGCRVADAHAPLRAQSVDLHFEPRVTPQGGLAEEMPFSIAAVHADGCDFGQHAYMRPATSVTGCCHLLTRKSLDGLGGFDLRFSPSQFDDFERDLRAAMRAHECAYNGHLAVSHKKRSGQGAKTTPRQQANIDGNMAKLMSGCPPRDVAAIVAADVARLERMLEEQLRALDGPGNRGSR